MTKKRNEYSWTEMFLKIAIFFSLGLHKWRQKLHEKPSALKKDPTPEKIKFINSLFLWAIFVLYPIREYGSNPEPDPQHRS